MKLTCQGHQVQGGQSRDLEAFEKAVLGAIVGVVHGRLLAAGIQELAGQTKGHKHHPGKQLINSVLTQKPEPASVCQQPTVALVNWACWG